MKAVAVIVGLAGGGVLVVGGSPIAGVLLALAPIVFIGLRSFSNSGSASYHRAVHTPRAALFYIAAEQACFIAALVIAVIARRWLGVGVAVVVDLLTLFSV